MRFFNTHKLNIQSPSLVCQFSVVEHWTRDVNIVASILIYYLELFQAFSKQLWTCCTFQLEGQRCIIPKSDYCIIVELLALYSDVKSFEQRLVCVGSRFIKDGLQDVSNIQDWTDMHSKLFLGHNIIFIHKIHQIYNLVQNLVHHWKTILEDFRLMNTDGNHCSTVMQLIEK